MEYYTLPGHMHTQNGVLVAMHMVNLILLCAELFCYAGEQSTLTQAKFAGVRRSGYRVTRLTVPDTLDEFCK